MVLLDKIVASPASGDDGVGKTIAMTLDLSAPVNVTGTPTLSLNDGGTATYVGGSGTNALTFSYTVAATDQSVTALRVTQLNLPNGATLRDGSGNAVNLAGVAAIFPGLQIDTTPPVVTRVSASPGAGDVGIGKTITFAVSMSKAVTVTGTPTLTLNNGATATYAGGAGSNALTFTYTVAATDTSVPALAITQVNLPSGATVQDGAGNAANLSGAVTASSLQIDTTSPAVTQIAVSPVTGNIGIGHTINFAVTLSEAVRIRGTPTLALNNGGVATYAGGYASKSALATTIANFTGGSSIDVLTFSYTVQSSDTSVAALAVTGVNLPAGASVQNAAGNAANLAGAAVTLTGLQVDTTIPAVTQVVASPATGTELPGTTITLTLDMSQAATVAGTPTLTLNDGGTATYTGGSGTTALTFSYTVAATDSPVSALAITQVNLPAGATISNAAGNAANFAGALKILTGLVIDAPPVVTKVLAAPASGAEGIGKTITLTVDFNRAVTVTGAPTLALNDGGSATYTGGSGTTALTFSYTVSASNTSVAALAVTAVNLPSGATVLDTVGTAANLAGAVTTLTGLQVDTTTTTIPAVTKVVASPATGDEGIGKTVTLTLTMSEAVTVTGSPTLALNNGGSAAFTGGSGTTTLTFSYTVSASNTSVAALAVTGVNLPSGASVQNAAGNAANLAGAAVTLTGLQIDVTIPAVTQVVASPATGTELPGTAITLTLDMSEAVTVTGTPTLSLNDGGTATFTGGSGTTALTFSYTVAATDSPVAALAITQVNLPAGATVQNAAGNTANLANALKTLTGLVIDPPAIVTKVVAAPATGDEGVGKTIALTLDMNAAVTVTGTPTLTLNDGGTATYTGGSGTNALTFSYTVGASNTSVAALAITGVNLPTGATVKDSLGVAANLSGAATTLSGLQIDTLTPAVTKVVASPATGTETVGNTVALTLNMNEAVTVTGTPTLTLNDGGTAINTGGSGTTALTFSYTVGPSDTAVSALGVTGTNLPNGATVKNGAGTAANLSGAVTTLSGLAVNPTTTAAGFYVSPNGNDSNAGTFAAPFATLARAQQAMEASSIKTTYVKGGTYHLSSTLSLTSADNGETWQYYPGNGYDTAVLDLSGLVFSDPGTPTGSVTTGILIQGGNNITIDGLAISGGGFLGSGITVHGGPQYFGTEYAATGAAHGNTITNCLVYNLGQAANNVAPYVWYAGIVAAGDVQNTTITNNVCHDLGGVGIGLDIGSQGPSGGGNNTLIANNVCYNLNTATGAGDTGGIYVIDRTGSTTGWAIKNNFIRDYGPNLNSFHAIYLDDSSSNVTVSGNVIAATAAGAGNGSAPIQYHIGGNNQITGNIIDLHSANPILWYQTAGAGNTFSGNIIIGGFTGSGGGYLQVTPPTGANLAVSNNDYYNYAGGTLQYTGSAATGGADSAPKFVDPQISGWTYNIAPGSPVLGALMNFSPIVGGWGPPGYTIPATGTPPSTPPSVTNVVSSPGSGKQNPGNVVTLTVNLDKVVTVTGTPTMTLNTGGIATYTSGSGTNALTFSYTVSVQDATVSALAITQVNLPNGATVKDSFGNSANLSGALVTFANLPIDPPDTVPKVIEVVASPAGGVQGIGSNLTLAVSMNESVNVSGGTPSLTLSDGGTATYDAAATSALGDPTRLIFDYTVAAGDSSTTALAVTGTNLNGATVQDAAGHNADFSGAVTTLAGLAIDPTTPTVTGVAAPVGNVTEQVGGKITLTVDLNEAVTVTGGTPTLALNDGGIAIYDQAATSAPNNPTNQLVFDYTVGASDASVASLAITGINLNGAAIGNVAGNLANLAGALTTLSGVQVEGISTSVGLLTQFIAAASNIGASTGSGAVATSSVAQEQSQFLAAPHS
jgi:large repetitive protein